MIECPYCNQIIKKIIENEELKSPFLKCDNCNKTSLYQSYNYSLYNAFGLKIIEGIKMEDMPKFFKNDKKAIDLYNKWIKIKKDKKIKLKI